MKIRKAIIPAAGLGTRFLPATKAQPKEMLPIVDKPTIQYIVEEAVASGIEEIIIIIGRGKRSIEDHFDKSYELEDALLRKDKLDILEEVQSISSLANIYYVRQKEALGLGHAILCAKSFIGNEPFAVLLGDDIVMSETPCLKQIIKVFEYCNSSVIAIQSVADNEVSKYGIIKPKGANFEPNLFYIEKLVEKPTREEAPSNLAIMGRYVLRPEIFEVLEELPIGQGGELQLTDAINELNTRQAVLAFKFEGKRYDIGDKIGFIKATVDFALQREDTRDDVIQYLKDVYEMTGMKRECD
ncbi:UTP--glucose-1-phosphate uridylyltransferase GalU [Mesobacillus subterraneus]|uniref:UTP--glucose-1-phosphate uridylyltransferase GalU n=1 Tax=Mesobacillus subterraneus TaxID=285983 RepID=UPI002040F7A9|nr:UTP--glucose-1-phosphate uridylyltransferase GalU [Mesobacillus subterraneus]MCM3666358.1 UTP--glucose-1-phosphate uridylyltransferase GalU [Mesobacillus subterraneus]MCM3685370.1 UTP--glucose-1-phosphate uridylyltransferase GalU [Mesobacillus subterraneus]